MKTIIAKRLRELRGNKRQKEIAGALGIKVDRYRAYENGRNEIPSTVFFKIMKYYELSNIQDLLGVSH